MHSPRRTVLRLVPVAVALVAVGIGAACLAGSSGPSGRGPTGSLIDGSTGRPRGAGPSPQVAVGSSGILGATVPGPVSAGTLRPPLAPPTEWTAPFSAAGRFLAAPANSFALRVPILMYHRIIPPTLAGDSLPSLVVPPGLFAAQLAELHATGWRTITLATLAADLAAHRRPPARTFVITIDDGHDDGYTYALPILQRFNDVATFFIVTGRLGKPGNLTDAEVQQMAAAGMEIADHTVRHAYLPALSIAAAQYQIEVAAATIAQLTGRGPETFAYPYGGEDPAAVALLASGGFAMAVTTREGNLETASNRLLVPRLRVGPATSPLQLVGEMMRSAEARPAGDRGLRAAVRPRIATS